MKSIMHDKKPGTCYLCMALHADYSRKLVLQEHHAIFGTSNRKLSEKYGLKVYLCLWHHTEGDEAVHRNAEIALMVKQAAQKAFEEKWPFLDFREIFGRSYTEDADLRQEGGETGQGISFIDDGLEGIDWEV